MARPATRRGSLTRPPSTAAGPEPQTTSRHQKPSITRSVALEALERAGVPWRIVCTCGSLSGLTAAARAGMGVLVQPRSMAPAGLREIASDRLPRLEDVEFVLVARRGADTALVKALSGEILSTVGGLQAAGTGKTAP